MGLVWILLFLLLVIVPWVIPTGTGTSERKLAIVRGMRAASIAILLLIGIPLVVLGLLSINESLSTETGMDASPALILGVLAVGFGSLLCVAGGFALWAWSRKASREAGGSTVERKGNDTHCKKCGLKLIGPGGPCRKCDDVQTRPCTSCGLYILANDKT